MAEKHSERIMVVPAAELDRLGRFQGFQADASRFIEALLKPEHVHFRPRNQVEDDPSLKQIIPYVIIRAGDQVFNYRRGKSQGETRLHLLRSIGIGGHVEESDTDGRPSLEGYEFALRRELEEEVQVDSPGKMRLVGMINDDATPVGSVHLGVVHILELERPSVTAREDGLADAGFADIPTIVALRHSYESWSQFCIDALLVGT